MKRGGGGGRGGRGGGVGEAGWHRRRPIVYRFPVMPSKERRERREQKRAVDARLGDGEMEGEEEGTEKLGIIGKVYGEGGGKEPDRTEEQEIGQFTCDTRLVRRHFKPIIEIADLRVYLFGGVGMSHSRGLKAPLFHRYIGTGSVLNKKVLKQRDAKQTIDISVKKTEKPSDSFLEFPPKPNSFTERVIKGAHLTQ
ncbi:hypothetical protein FQN60_017049 [Etheostoma spectabile]|uniref:Uncharacterized protein n=1 Tax=Etheostoma spectabile TaxID=54343 RepID=A0A5J5DED5_9PERO|nr:hypothetical protein FQN60_017049 [Etheostoma spectabile]